MSLFARLFGVDKSKEEVTPNDNISRNESAVSYHGKNINDGELVAVIMAALMNMFSANAVSDLRIKSIRRIGRNSPIWNTAGRDEYIASKL